MSTVLFKGKEVALNGELLSVGQKAPDFRFVRQDLSEQSLYALGEGVKVLICLPSLDTGVCAMETRTFNEKLADIQGVKGLVLSKDLPFAMKRFCELEGITAVFAASDFRYQDFASLYKVEMVDGPLKGLHARIVFVLDAQNTIRYVEVAPDVTKEPDYDAVLEAVKACL